MQAAIENKIEFTANGIRFDRKQNFDTATDIARHNVRTADIIDRIAVVCKTVDACMFQKTVQNTDDI